MHRFLAEDHAQFDKILENTLSEANRFLAEVDRLPVGTISPPNIEEINISDEGIGALETLDVFKERYASWMSGSAGPRYYGFVTGGVTPAALAGDWLTSVYDQNSLGSDESIAPQIELDTIALLRQLFGLPDDYTGSFVTGATMSNFVGLALARQWIGHQRGVDFSKKGLWGMEPIKIFSGTPHSSIYKSLSMLGMGREAIISIPCLPNREAIDVSILEGFLENQNDQPCIVVANAGTVNTVDFDDLIAITALKTRYKFWLHVDAAFGGFAACSPKYRSLVQGMELADSITIDAHKWLNVPYDAAIQFTRHLGLQAEVFQNAAVYLEEDISSSNFVHLTPENSRRLRAMPSWFSLMAYGKEGYTEIVERNCQLAEWLGKEINRSEFFKLLAPVHLNGICFTFKVDKNTVSLNIIKEYLNMLKENGDVFLTPTVYQGIPAIRISIANWRTTQKDVEIAWQAMQEEIGEYI
ncbi:MAG: aspartate aminotransferase family protein [Anaerolineae bacterium]|jgi:glutamate/tyrosine decarboxylase-like PLP-dependent enzyme|nr:aspartate aminotransferase family protein [Anaerolineae bacterium]MBT3712926.1 aspartate aminotransferase family protein [Anaerolineae bacterium]MBT4310820.1 aspartate aminotransferase family protein [Anaerolineae bacterium]MBT4456852.1 aspartate aminotransferase family protein [Anaerolineae bacterium]MBT6061325.1 aspartate aminotransferase family protein [Anaerolineae bacterium]